MQFLFLAIAALYKLPSDKSSYLLMVKVFNYLELAVLILTYYARNTVYVQLDFKPFTPSDLKTTTDNTDANHTPLVIAGC